MYCKADSDVVWLARSCVGEAGWDSWKTGECAAILHIYKKRAKIANVSVLQNAKSYSSAIKNYKGKRNKWVVGLQGDSKKPVKWPKNLNWNRFKFDWIMTLLTVELFLLNMIDDPLPNALHYGCLFDKPDKNFKLIRVKFRNRFYERI